MKKILLLLVVLVSSVTFAQNNGITYQAVIYSTTGESVPGIKNSNAPLSNKTICLQFSIVDFNSSTEYQEKVTVTTDDYGMVNLVIGNGTQTGGYANSFNAVVWSNPNKYLKVSVDQTGNCSLFELISDQILTHVPFALAANFATSVSGIVGIVNGGTNATTVLGAKTNLELQNVDNTSDLNKPLSTATQTALNTKVDKVAGKVLSSEDFTTEEKTKLASLGGTPNLSSYATITNLTTKVDKVIGKELSSNDYTILEKNKLAAISGVNTGDQDLSLLAPLLSPNFSGTPIAPTASSNNNTTQIATTAFVNNALVNKFVDLTNNQTISGFKTFNSDLVVNGLIIGKGKGQNNYNTVFGAGALNSSNANGTRNTAIGYLALTQYAGTTFDNNTGVGYFNMIGLTTGYGNTSIGAETMFNVGTASNNTGIGNQSLINVSGDNNVGVGARSGDGLTTGTNNTFIGTQARTTNQGATISNATAIGYGAVVTENNTIQLGNSGITTVKTSGSYVGLGFKTPTGTSSQYLMADGSVMSSTLSNYLPISGGNMTGQLAIGASTPQSSAALDVSSTTQGFLPPRLTQSQRNAISNPVSGLVVWCKNCGSNGELQVYNGTTWTNMIGGVASVVPINIGDSYGGGTVIYLFQSGNIGYVAGEFHGVIIANDDAGYSPWGCNGTTTNATGIAVGSATQNTANIIASNCSGTAAQLCVDYRGGGYSDWSLPSIDELNIVFTNKSYLPSSLSQYLYWSSSETSSAAAYRKDMRNTGTGSAPSFGKTSHSHVRAVRYF